MWRGHHTPRAGRDNLRAGRSAPIKPIWRSTAGRADTGERQSNTAGARGWTEQTIGGARRHSG